MGCLRLILAIGVVVAHVPGETLRFATGGEVSVQCFYLVSGFLITLILNEKYSTARQNLLFYTNRVIRIFSLYWLFLLATASVAVAAYLWAGRGVFAIWAMNHTRLTPFDATFFVATNLFIVGQDFTLFLGLMDSGLVWTVDQSRLVLRPAS